MHPTLSWPVWLRRPRRKPCSHASNVALLFDELSSLDQSSWLETLRRRALKKESSWKADAYAYLHGLTAAGAVSPDRALLLQKAVARCTSGVPRMRDFLLPLAWMGIVAAIAQTCTGITIDMTTQAPLAALAAVGGGWWAATRVWMDRRNDQANQKAWERPFVMVVCSLLSPMAAFVIGLLMATGLQALSVWRFEADRHAFESDPQGFPILQALARDQYGMDVVLGDSAQSWATTSLNLPNASVASMAVRAGFCHLNMHRANVLRDFEAGDQVDHSRWLQGVMMHEFAHCLDLSRDLPSFGQHTIGTRSLPPAVAQDVKDVQELLQAGSIPETRLWREAVADVFAVGFWRVTAPQEADGLIDVLRRHRDSAKQDRAHATMCWIDAARQAAPPASTADLFTWAERLRVSAPCQLPHR